MAVLQTEAIEKACCRDPEYKATTIKEKASHSSLCSSDYRAEI